MQIVKESPRELFVLSEAAYRPGAKVKIWYCVTPRELLIEMSHGNGWTNTGSSRDSGEIKCGVVTYFAQDGAYDLSSFFSSFWRDYVLYMINAGAEEKRAYGRNSDFNDLSWEFDAWQLEDEARLRKKFVDAWEVKFKKYLSSL